MDSKSSATLQIPLLETMNSELYQCISSGDYDKFLSLIYTYPSLLDQTTIQKNTVLHVAATFKQKRIAEEIMRQRPSILHATNLKEDTALHLAARIGSYRVVEYLAKWRNDSNNNNNNNNNNDLEADDRNNELLKMVNLKKDTALHDAIRNGHVEIAKLLVKECPELAAYANNVGESPLFLAVEKDYLDIAEKIINVDSTCLYGGRDGVNVLDAIIIRMLKGYNQGLFETPARVYLDLLQALYASASISVRLKLPYWERKIIRKLSFPQKDFIKKVLDKFPNILKEPDIYGWLPLHYAAYVGSDELVKLILDRKPSLAYEKEKNGDSALHLAAKEGRTAVLTTFAKHYPESCEQLNSKDQTALHVAVANRQAFCVWTMLELGSFRNMVNQQDEDGNTPLHLAAIAGDYHIVMILVFNGRVDKKIMNNECLTTNDIIQLNPKFKWFQKFYLIARLEYDRALRSMEYILARKTESNLLENYVKKSNVKQQETNGSNIDGKAAASIQEQKSQIWGGVAEANLIVATIIATVTFSATFQIPGGYQSDGVAVLRHKKYFRWYLITDALSFGFAVASMFFTFFAGLFGDRLGFSYPRKWVTLLTGISLWFMVFAFMLGTSAVMAENSGFAGLIRIVACSSFVWPVVFLGLVTFNWFAFFL